MPKDCNFELPNTDFSKCLDNRIITTKITFKDGKMYENDVYIDDVQEDKEGLFVVMKSENRYLDGQIIRIKIIKLD